MTAAAARAPSARPLPLKVFIARAEARALLWQAGEFDLHEAIDELQAAAVRDGLVAAIGQDEVQAIMSAAFAAVRDDACPTTLADAEHVPHLATAAPADDHYDGSTFAALCRQADEKAQHKPVDPTIARVRRLLADDVSLERAWDEINRPAAAAAASTVEALMFSLHERGAAALAEPVCQRRLADLSSAQVREVIARLIALRPRYPAAITDELLFLLGEQLS
jgi:hypothetical protein